MPRDIAPGPSAPRSTRAGKPIIAVIGIDHYAAWPRLENAVGDAAAASRMFRHLGFDEVTSPLLDRDATGEALRRLVTEDLAQLSSDDSLVLFFAGHGHTHTAQIGDVSVKTGCLIPVDGALPRGHVAASWLRLDTWLSDIARLPPRHILVIIDACHSGISLSAVHRWRAEEPSAPSELAALHARRSRRIITSALDDQLALDSGPYPGHSLFTGCLIEALSGGLARTGQRVTTGRELGHYLQKRVRSYPPSLQTPDFGTFELDDRGDIVVPLLSESPGADSPSLASTNNAAAVNRRATAGASGANRRLLLGIGLAIGVALIAIVLAISAEDTGPLTHAPGTGDNTGAPVSPGLATTGTEFVPTPDAATLDAAETEAMQQTTRMRGRTDRPIEPGILAARHDVSKRPALPRRRRERAMAPASSAAKAALHVPDPATSLEDSPEGATSAQPSVTLDCKADFAGVYKADTSTSAEITAALQALRACHAAGAISDADFERHQRALVGKELSYSRGGSGPPGSSPATPPSSAHDSAP